MCILCSKDGDPLSEQDMDTTITFLDCSNCPNHIFIPDIFPELLFLLCFNSQVEILPSSSFKLKGLYAYNSKIKIIPDYPNIRIIDE